MIQAVTFKVQPAAMRRIERSFQTMPQRMHAQFGKAFRDWGEQWRGEMLDRFRPESGALHNRSGNLRNSLDANVTGEGSAALKLKLVSGGVPYARIQEFGGVVRPVRARFLWIPTNAAKTASGDARFKMGPRAFIAAHPGETFFLRKNGALLLMWKNPSAAVRRDAKGKPGEAVALWFAVKSVTIPPRLGFHDTWKLLSRERRRDLLLIARELGRIP